MFFAQFQCRYVFLEVFPCAVTLRSPVRPPRRAKTVEVKKTKKGKGGRQWRYSPHLAVAFAGWRRGLGLLAPSIGVGPVAYLAVLLAWVLILPRRGIHTEGGPDPTVVGRRACTEGPLPDAIVPDTPASYLLSS